MSGIGDLTSNLSIDTSEFVAPIENAADVAQQSGEKIIRVIHEQETSWLSMVANVAPSLAHLGTAIAGMATAAYTLTKQRELIAAAGTAWALSGQQVLTYGRRAIQVLGFVNPYIKAISLAITVATVAYKVGSNEIVQNTVRQSEVGQKLSAAYKDLTGAAGRLGASFSSMASSGIEMATDSLTTATNAVISGGLELLKHSTIVQTANLGLTKFSEGMEWAAKKTDEFNDILPTIRLYTENLGNVSAETAQKFYEEGNSLKVIAAETERVIALQESHRASYQTLSQIQAQATASAEHAAEVQRLGSLTSIEAIEKEEDALRKKSAAAIQAGKPMDTKQLQDLFGALANQKQGVLSGRVKPEQSPVEKMIADAQKQLSTLQTSEFDVAMSAAKAAGATDAQLVSLRNLLSGVNEAKAANEALKQSEEDRNDALKKQAALEEQGIAKIEAMRDKIDLLTGAATEGDIAMRELSRQGFTDDQVAEVGALTDELKKLEDEKNKKDKKPAGQEKQSNTAVLAGTSQAASIMLRGVLGAGSSTTEKLQRQMITEQKNTTKAIRDNKPDEPPSVVGVL